MGLICGNEMIGLFRTLHASLDKGLTCSRNYRKQVVLFHVFCCPKCFYLEDHHDEIVTITNNVRASISCQLKFLWLKQY